MGSGTLFSGIDASFEKKVKTGRDFTARAHWRRKKKSRRGGMLDQSICDRDRV
jgi:hypothetical protein